MSKPTYSKLLRACQEAYKMACDWRPDFLEPEEAEEYDNQLERIAVVIGEADENKQGIYDGNEEGEVPA